MKTIREKRLITTAVLCGVVVLMAPFSIPAATKSDFNGDGWGDLAVGVPLEDVNGKSDAGGIEILYGSASGLSSKGRQFITQDSPNCPETAEVGAIFGLSSAAGDFNKDGFSDLAVGAPYHDLAPVFNTGVVHIFYGAASGLACSNSVAWRENDFAGASVQGAELFGYALAVGDFNLDGYSDLAIGAPRDQVSNATGAGSVRVVYGGNGGLVVNGSKLWTLDTPGILETAAPGDHFGWSLAAGNFGKGGHADLAIGIPFRIVGSADNAGAVTVIYGSDSGLISDGNQFWSQDSLGIPGVAEVEDCFGSPLAAGNFGGTPQDDLAIAATGEDRGTGVVHILYGSTTGLKAKDNESWFGAATDDYYGRALVAADFGHSTHADLAIGAPADDVAGFVDAGSVHVLYGSSSGLSLATAQSLTIHLSVAAEDRFGWALAAANFGKDGRFDLAVGIPFRTVGAFVGGMVNTAGAVSVLYGSPNGLTSPQLWSQSFLSGVPDRAEAGDGFGYALSQ